MENMYGSLVLSKVFLTFDMYREIILISSNVKYEPLDT